MISVNRVLRPFALAVAAAFIVSASPSAAQEIAESHLKAARAAVSAIRATDLFDGILPASAGALRQALIEKNPDMQEEITRVVGEKALEMAARRADLEREAALAYARVFSEADLNAIAAFYTSEPGKKLLADGPIVTRELSKAADIWQRGIGRDLAVEVSKVLGTSETKSPTLPEQPIGEAIPIAPAN